MYGEDPRDFGLGPPDDEERDPRAKNDDEETFETNRPRTTVYSEAYHEE